MEINRGAVAGWSGGVCGGAPALAGVITAEEGPTWRPVVVVLIIVAAIAFVILLWTGFQPARIWLAERLPHRQPPPKPALTDHWRFTTNGFEVPILMRTRDRGFDHPGHMRAAQDRPPALRVTALVACGPLGETPDWGTLRDRFNTLLTRPMLMDTITGVTAVRSGEPWQSRATMRRSYLESDLPAEDQDAAPVASAILMLPEEGLDLAGTDSRFAELTLHVDIIREDYHGQVKVPEQAYGLPGWRERILRALTLPTELAEFLTGELRLPTSDSPPAQFGLLLRSQGPLTEIVDSGTLKALPSPYLLNEFTAWAVASPDGKTIGDMSAKMVKDLSERVLHLEGSEAQLAGLAD